MSSSTSLRAPACPVCVDLDSCKAQLGFARRMFATAPSPKGPWRVLDISRYSMPVNGQYGSLFHGDLYRSRDLISWEASAGMGTPSLISGMLEPNATLDRRPALPRYSSAEHDCKHGRMPSAHGPANLWLSARRHGGEQERDGHVPLLMTPRTWKACSCALRRGARGCLCSAAVCKEGEGAGDMGRD